jgi:hypothetical protein
MWIRQQPCWVIRADRRQTVCGLKPKQTPPPPPPLPPRLFYLQCHTCSLSEAVAKLGRMHWQFEVGTWGNPGRKSARLHFWQRWILYTSFIIALRYHYVILYHGINNSVSYICSLYSRSSVYKSTTVANSATPRKQRYVFFMPSESSWRCNPTWALAFPASRISKLQPCLWGNVGKKKE